MSPGWKLTVVVVAVAGIVSTPLFWLLDSPDTGQLVGASVQAAVAVGALAWALFQRPQTSPAPAPVPGPVDTVADTGKAEATGGGSANSGVLGTGGAGSGSATVERSGDSTADGAGSRANTGVDHS
ncbi:hypothetical protein [Streptomyces venezuelae]|uniref:hypothetical protein n=1 Tax=Streptomyces venezuelae TaxID=54571 RepID=UPI003324114E